MKRSWTLSQKAILTCGVALAPLLALEPTPALALCVNGATGTVTVADSPVANHADIGAGANCTVETGASISVIANSTDGLSGTNNSTIINDGSITTDGTSSMGIELDDNAIITNNGTLLTKQNSSTGIRTDDDAVIINNGSIETRGDLAYGIQVVDRGQVTNNGTITTIGLSSIGIRNSSNGTTINNGTITTSGTGAHGIRSQSQGTMTNNGRINTSGNGAHGLYSIGDDVIINQGFVKATGITARAIEFTQGTNELVLNPGSVVVGDIQMGTGTDTLTIGRGLSVVTTFTASNGAPEIVRSAGGVHATNGDQVAVVDTTGIKSLGNAVDDLTGAVSTTLGNRLTDTSSTQDLSTLSANGTPIQASTSGYGQSFNAIWGRGIGGISFSRKSDTSAASQHNFGGLVFGADRWITSNTQIGLFAGGSRGRIEVDHAAQVIDMNSFYGGLYGRYSANGYFINLSVTGGKSSHDSERSIANNTTTTGLETASASFNSIFFSPEITFGSSFRIANQKFKPSLALNYSGTWFESYTETGTAAPLTVNKRDAHTLSARFQLAVPINLGETTRFEGRIGVDGKINIGGDAANGTLLSQSVSFDTTNNDTKIDGFIGAYINGQISETASWFAGLEVASGTHTKIRADAQAGFRIRF